MRKKIKILRAICSQDASQKCNFHSLNFKDTTATLNFLTALDLKDTYITLSQEKAFPSCVPDILPFSTCSEFTVLPVKKLHVF